MTGFTSMISLEYHGESEAIFVPLWLTSSDPIPDSPVFLLHAANDSDTDSAKEAATAFLTVVFILFLSF